jgi:hypothetical protein
MPAKTMLLAEALETDANAIATPQITPNVTC